LQQAVKKSIDAGLSVKDRRACADPFAGRIYGVADRIASIEKKARSATW